jgi:hypothetical protein
MATEHPYLTAPSDPSSSYRVPIFSAIHLKGQLRDSISKIGLLSKQR